MKNKNSSKKTSTLEWDKEPEMSHQSPQAFKLHIGPAVTPDELKAAQPQNVKATDEKKPAFQKFHSAFKPVMRKAGEIKEKMGDKIWGTVRFISTSAIIFIILFFAMNWNAYQAIIMSKLGLNKPSEQLQEFLPLNGTAENNNQTTTSPDLMDLSKDPEEQKSQIPAFNLEITPPDTRVVIPRIGENVPVISISSDSLVNREWDKLEQQIQEGLRSGVVHYPGTAYPGEKGNIVLTGHSSYFVWDSGRFKDVFALLHDVQIGDRVYMFYKQKKFVYEVYDIKVVLPTQVDVLTQAGEDRLTLITCTPVGTNLKRLIILAKPV